jgi:hypothetical protein
MGQRVKPPKYVNRFVDRKGMARFYFRRPGFPRLVLPGPEWSPRFMAAYQEAMAGQPLEIGAKRTKAGSINALCVMYCNSVAFRTLSAETQRSRRGILERFRTEHGDKPYGLLHRKAIVSMLGGKMATPSAARNWLNTVRALMQFALDESLIEANPARDVETPTIRTNGYKTWGEDHIALYRERHALGTCARLALELAINIGSRRGDIVRICRQQGRRPVLPRREEQGAGRGHGAARTTGRPRRHGRQR